MDMKYYYKTSDGKVVELEQQNELWLSIMNMLACMQEKKKRKKNNRNSQKIPIFEKILGMRVC